MNPETQSLAGSLQEARRKGHFCDVFLHVGEQTVAAHAVVLRRSPFFAAFLHPRWTPPPVDARREAAHRSLGAWIDTNGRFHLRPALNAVANDATAVDETKDEAAYRALTDHTLMPPAISAPRATAPALEAVVEALYECPFPPVPADSDAHARNAVALALYFGPHSVALRCAEWAAKHVRPDNLVEWVAWASQCVLDIPVQQRIAAAAERVIFNDPSACREQLCQLPLSWAKNAAVRGWFEHAYARLAFLHACTTAAQTRIQRAFALSRAGTLSMLQLCTVVDAVCGNLWTAVDVRATARLQGQNGWRADAGYLEDQPGTKNPRETFARHCAAGSGSAVERVSALLRAQPTAGRARRRMRRRGGWWRRPVPQRCTRAPGGEEGGRRPLEAVPLALLRAAEEACVLTPLVATQSPPSQGVPRRATEAPPLVLCEGCTLNGVAESVSEVFHAINLEHISREHLRQAMDSNALHGAHLERILQKREQKRTAVLTAWQYASASINHGVRWDLSWAEFGTRIPVAPLLDGTFDAVFSPQWFFCFGSLWALRLALSPTAEEGTGTVLSVHLARQRVLDESLPARVFGDDDAYIDYRQGALFEFAVSMYVPGAEMRQAATPSSGCFFGLPDVDRDHDGDRDATLVGWPTFVPVEYLGRRPGHVNFLVQIRPK